MALSSATFNNICQNLNGHGDPSSEWTMSHSFCAIMGGFVIDTGRPDAPFLPGSPRLTLSPDGVLFLAKHEKDLLTSIPMESITNRSKSDSIAKLLICLQAMWMIFQCIGRLASHLPITLLEINTLGHVICAILLYTVWFNKPQDLNDPISLKGQSVRAWGALLAMCSSWNGQCGIHYEISRLIYYSPGFTIKSPVGLSQMSREEERNGSLQTNTLLSADPTDAGRANLATSSSDNSHSSSIPVVGNPDLRTSTSFPPARLSQQFPATGVQSPRVIQHRKCPRLGDSRLNLSLPICPDDSVWVSEGESLGVNGFGPKFFEDFENCNFHAADPSKSRILRVDVPSYIRILRVDVPSSTRFKLATECLNNHPKLFTENEADLKDLGTQTRLIVPESLDWNGEGFLHQLKPKRQLLLCLASSIFGVLHALAWNSFFPSTYEQTLWRVSAAFIASCSMFAAIWFTVDNIIRWMSDGSLSLRKICYPFYLNMPLLWESLLVILPLTYLVARIYLLVESFISLRDLPSAAYQTPNWTQLIPHF